jgi:hypothetical protein|tara:strand:- start:2294 stop:2521 length:228 start_codon:yes stop_codon:yes gene_type:complete
MEEILILVESYGLPLVLLLGALYALYRFFVFSLYEVKNEFGKRHEDNAKAMSELKIAVAELKEKISTVLDFVKRK